MSRDEAADLKQFLIKRFDSIDRRFDAVENRLTQVEHRLDRVEEHVACTNRKIDDLSAAVAQALDASNEACARQHKEHRLRLAYLEGKIA